MTDPHLALLVAARRSRIKTRVWSALCACGVALPAELAEAAHTTIARVHAAMRGDGRTFSRETSLVALSAAIVVRTPRGEAYAITPAGLAAWSAIRPRVGFTDAQIRARWPAPGSWMAPPGWRRRGAT